MDFVKILFVIVLILVILLLTGHPVHVGAILPLFKALGS